MLERKVFKVLDRWKKEKNHLPIIIKGLRQVGKTTSVIEFAKQNYENAFFLDFRSFIELRLVFSGNFDIDEILLKLSPYKARLSIINGSDFIPYKTVFIFDEIQDCPDARSSLKYFALDKRFDVISTGSYLGIDGYRDSKLASRGIGVGYEYQIEMKPLDFEEFLWSLNIDKKIIEKLINCVDKSKQIDSYYHNLLLNLIKKYICVGGMPKAVTTFLDTNDLDKVREVQVNLIKSFKSDFGMHLSQSGEIRVDESEKRKILDVFDSIPKQLAKENNKFQYSLVNKGGSQRTYQDSLKWLKEYGLIDVCHNVSTLEEPLSFFAIDNQFKVYFSDIGLLMASLPKEIAFKVINDDLGLGKGAIFENLIAETLNKNRKKLFYFAKSSGLEIDFIETFLDGLYLIEVKARSGNAKSSKTVLANPNYKVKGLIKFTAQNIGQVDNKKTIPYYLAFYVTSKEFFS